jgi:hypothetical protein
VLVDLPEPLVSPEIELRDYPYTPLYRARLFQSRFHHLASADEWRAGVILWLKSWDQVPAGSLPSDERELALLAEVGRDLRAWRKVRKWALYGWKLAPDGRLYHRVVAEGVKHAWQQKQSNRHRTAAATAARQRQRDDNRSDVRSAERRVTATSTKAKLKEQAESVSSRKESQSPRARGNGGDHKNGEIKSSIPSGSLRSPAPSAPLKNQIKEQLRQKVMRFAHATFAASERSAAFLGLMGEDPEHSAQWWLDTLDQAMKAQRWDDAI